MRVDRCHNAANKGTSQRRKFSYLQITISPVRYDGLFMSLDTKIVSSLEYLKFGCVVMCIIPLALL